ncbi:hypothetical protein [Sinirhodobacter huangdaonensis]|uniref:DUF1579 domain-containing protein n=1 Tax=Paenirhodobacter huangdaonensis TaxID=2501515 RepID=A0A443LX51_9RHOB|nr:hypothetical protein [Sinirhodobacter huangdaonensis]RWR53821.1 hypothetical protein EOW66_04175 [Sinirhodobacter huangdaonensis]
MVYLVRALLWAAPSLLVASLAHAVPLQGPGGFVLGSSLKAAQQHALENGWKLSPLSADLPGVWSVEGARLSMFVCDGTIMSIQEQLDGDLEEFSALVFSMTLELGKPETQILSVKSGGSVISSIDARFVTDDGGVAVQLQSIGGKRTFSTNHWIKSECR